MNAYELADIVDRWAYKESAEYLTDAANMLRQQANRIVELEKELYFKNYYEELPDTPVGIIGKIGDSPIHDLVHRTAPQIKELSNEEILNVANNLKESNETYNINFARAILKKASEK